MMVPAMAGDGVTKKQPSCSASCCCFCDMFLVDGGKRKSQPQVGWRQVKCDGGGTAASVTHSRQALLVR